jgi:DNA-binding MarR family transcriptional regulator
MMINKSAATELFMKMWTAWESTVPKVLVRENPRILIRFLELSASDEGIFQQELKRQLGLNQPRISKLTQKLIGAQWIVLLTPDEDKRKRTAFLTKTGRQGFANVRSSLDVVVAKPVSSALSKSAQKGIRPAVGQQRFF